MADKKEEKSVDVSELQKNQETLTAQVAELQAKLETSEAEKKKAEEEKGKAEDATSKAIELAKAQDVKIAELQAEQAAIRGKNYMAELQRLRKKDGKTYQVSPAYLDVVKPIIEKNGIIELAKGQSQQDAMFRVFDEIASMGGAVVIQLSTEGKKSYSSPEQKPNKQDRIQELMKEEELSENDAWVRATEELGEYNTQEVQ